MSEELAPICPECGVMAVFVTDDFLDLGPHWETAHKPDCPWMLDPDSEPYP